jgi:hypothetical protein
MELFFFKATSAFQFVNAFAAATVANSCSVVANALLDLQHLTVGTCIFLQ